MNRQLFALLAVALLAGAGGYFAAMQFTGESPADSTGGSNIGQSRPGFSHADLQGRVVTAADFDGEVLLVNFWATWCEPCVEEMPMLSELRDGLASQGFEIVGIAVDEPTKATQFALRLGLSYPVLVGETDVVLSNRRYGNASGMLPYSVLIDRNGMIRWVKLGALERAELVREIKALIGSD